MFSRLLPGEVSEASDAHIIHLPSSPLRQRSHPSVSLRHRRSPANLHDATDAHLLLAGDLSSLQVHSLLIPGHVRVPATGLDHRPFHLLRSSHVLLALAQTLLSLLSPRRCTDVHRAEELVVSLVTLRLPGDGEEPIGGQVLGGHRREVLRHVHGLRAIVDRRGLRHVHTVLSDRLLQFAHSSRGAALAHGMLEYDHALDSPHAGTVRDEHAKYDGDLVTASSETSPAAFDIRTRLHLVRVRAQHCAVQDLQNRRTARQTAA